MKAFLFPGQGSQFVGMGKDLYDSSPRARELFEQADDILGYRITDIMFSGTDEELRQTRVTQPAVFLHSVIAAICMMDQGDRPDMVAGHSLGEFSALVASGALDFADGLKLVYERAMAMQQACEMNPGSMAAVINLPDERIAQLCAEVDGIVIPANFNCPGQVVISGAADAVAQACGKMLEAGAKRALPLPVGGAFHSPLMEPARERLAKAIEATEFHVPVCPIYQNVDAQPYSDPASIKANLLMQLTSPVRWTDSVRNMIADGMDDFVECGPGTVIANLVARIRRSL